MKKKIKKITYDIRQLLYVLIVQTLIIGIYVTNINEKWNLSLLVILTLANIILTIVVSKQTKEEMTQKFKEFTNDFNIVTQNMLVNSPLALVIVESDGNVLWKSKKFNGLFSKPEVLEKIENMAIEMKMEIENSQEDYEIKRKIRLEGRDYYVVGQYSRSKKIDVKKQKEYILTLIFLDQTGYNNLKQRYEEEKLAFGIIRIDNFDEVIAKLSSAEKPRIYAEIERNVYKWVNEYNGIILKPYEDEFIALFERKKLEKIKKDKFSILDKTKEIIGESGLPCTLSIALNAEGYVLEDIYSGASELLDIVLGRGGDQAGIKENGEIKFYGGKSKEVEKTAKVKARIVSMQLGTEAKKASNILIMGHLNIDIDALGSAVGMYRFLSEYNENVYIASNADAPGLGNYRDVIKEEYSDKKVLITKQEALSKVNEDTLLVIVDVHRKEFTEYPELVDEVQKIAIIDHHRKLVDFIDKAKIVYHEVYASSASELVTELIQYSEKRVKLSSFEAESLYGGMLVDTKNFTFKTGVRTFEAAAFLRKSGIDIVKVKKWFESNLESYMNIYDIIKNSKLIADGIVIARNEKESIDANLVGAKAADQMLNISNIRASITYGSDGKNITVSLRSTGDVNMQIIAEKLGGGGHLTLAGAQLKDKTLADAEKLIIKAVKEYIDEIES